MIKLKAFAPLCLASLVIAGCSAKSGGGTTSRPESAEAFRLDATDEARLKRVGCRVEATAVTCSDESLFPGANDRHLDLSLKKDRADQQRVVLDAIGAELDTRLKSGGVPANQRADAHIFSTRLTLARVDLIKRSANGVVELAYEKLFQTVLGYQCDGSYLKAGEVTPLEKAFVLPSSGAAPVAANYVFGDASAGRADITVASRPSAVSTRVNDGASEPLTAFSVMAVVDGEFKLQTRGDSKFAVECFKRRASGTAQTFTDRPLERRYWKCESGSHFLQAGVPSPTKAIGMAVQFDIGASAEPKTTSIGSLKIDGDAGTKEFMKDSAYANLVYDMNVTQVNGLLTFRITKRGADTLVAELTAVNTAPSVNFGIKDRAGNSVLVTCRDEVK